MGCKIFGLIPRKPDMSSEQFHDYYRHPHGTLGRNVTTMRGYVQSHQMHCDLLPADQSEFEAVAEIWLDNAQDAIDFRQEPVVVNHLVDDEPNFVDLPRLKFFAGTEEVIASGPRQDATLSAADRMWSPARAPITVKLLHFIAPDGNRDWASADDVDVGRRLGALRHVRCHPLAAVHGDAPSFLGLQELWWPTRSAFEEGVAAEPDLFARFMARAASSLTLLCQAERFI